MFRFPVVPLNFFDVRIDDDEDHFCVGFSPTTTTHLSCIIRTRKLHCSNGEGRATSPVFGDPRLGRQLVEWHSTLSRPLRLDSDTGLSFYTSDKTSSYLNCTHQFIALGFFIPDHQNEADSKSCLR